MDPELEAVLADLTSEHTLRQIRRQAEREERLIERELARQERARMDGVDLEREEAVAAIRRRPQEAFRAADGARDRALARLDPVAAERRRQERQRSPEWRRHRAEYMRHWRARQTTG